MRLMESLAVSLTIFGILGSDIVGLGSGVINAPSSACIRKGEYKVIVVPGGMLLPSSIIELYTRSSNSRLTKQKDF